MGNFEGFEELLERTRKFVRDKNISETDVKEAIERFRKRKKL